VAFEPGAQVHVARLGKGIVRDVRNRGRYLVEIKGNAMVVAEDQLSPLEPPKRKKGSSASSPAPSATGVPLRQRADASIDLHGMTVAEAEAAIDVFLNEALLASLEEVRVVHGRSGGRLKSAVHARLRQLPPVRSFRIDPRNEGVTIVTL